MDNRKPLDINELRKQRDALDTVIKVQESLSLDASILIQQRDAYKVVLAMQKPLVISRLLFSCFLDFSMVKCAFPRADTSPKPRTKGQ